MGHAGGRPQARRRDRREPADRRDPGDGQPAHVRRQRLRPGDQQQGLREAPRGPEQAAPEPRDPGALPARLHVQARDGHRRADRPQDLADDAGPDEAVPAPRPDEVLGVEPPRLGADHDPRAGSPTRATRSSSSSPACWGSIDSPTGRTSTASASRPASTCRARSPASSRRTPGSRRRSARTSSPARSYQAGIGQGYDVVTPIQLINAYSALANGGKLYQPQIVRDIVGPDGSVVRPVPAEADPPAGRAAEHAQDDAPRGPERRPRPAHVQPGGPADRRRRQVGNGRVRAARQQGPPAVPLVVRGVRPEAPGEDRSRIRAD